MEVAAAALGGGESALPDAPELPEVKTPGFIKSFSFIGNRHDLLEFEETMRKLEIIQEKCKDGEIKEEKDPFLKLKAEIYTDINDCKRLIRQKLAEQKEKGSTVSVIKANQKIGQSLDNLEPKFTRAKEIFKKQTKQVKKIGEAELDKRFKDLEVMKKHIAECKDLNYSPGQYSQEEVRTMTDFRRQLEEQGIELPPPPPNYRPPTAEEAATLDKWKERDADFDRQLDDVGNVVDRLGEIAFDIGEKAEKQNELAVAMIRQTDEANEELVELNTTIRGIMKKSGGMNLCCKLGLSVLLVFLICFMGSLVTDRIFG